LIRYLRANSAGSLYSASISPPAAQQVIAAMKIIMGEDGTDLGQRKLTQLRENSNMFRKAIMAMVWRRCSPPPPPLLWAPLLMCRAMLWCGVG
jgi:hypothetical protein